MRWTQLALNRMGQGREGMGGRGEGVDDELVAALWLIVGPWRFVDGTGRVAARHSGPPFFSIISQFRCTANRLPHRRASTHSTLYIY